MIPGGEFAHAYFVELYCESGPLISKRALFDSLKKRCPGAQPLDGRLDNELLSFVHLDHRIPVEGGSIPAQTFVSASEKPVNPEALEPSLEQSWGFPDARKVLARARTTVLVTDLMSSTLEPKERVCLFVQAIAAVLEVLPCLAIHWPGSGQLVDPASFLQRLSEGEDSALLAGPINVRFFRVSTSPGDMVMDTLGLTALGLPDLQCHFRGLSPNEVARVLYNTALYVLDRGDVIEDGNTVQGILTADKWRCQHEQSLVPPSRTVVDFEPGHPFAAGKRR